MRNQLEYAAALNELLLDLVARATANEAPNLATITLVAKLDDAVKRWAAE